MTGIPSKSGSPRNPANSRNSKPAFKRKWNRLDLPSKSPRVRVLQEVLLGALLLLAVPVVVVLLLLAAVLLAVPAVAVALLMRCLR